MTDILIHAFFEDSTNLDGETGLSPTVDIRSIQKDDLTNTLVVNDQAMTEIGGGLYAYQYDSADLDVNDYVAVAKTTSSDVVSKQVPALRWNDVSPNLSISISATEAAALADNQVPIYLAYTLEQTITSTSTEDLSTATKLWFAVKKSNKDADSSALIFIEKTDGLTVLNKDVYTTTGDGSLTVSGSSGAWSITIKIEEAATALLKDFGTHPMELKALVGGDTVFISGGTSPISRRTIQAKS